MTCEPRCHAYGIGCACSMADQEPCDMCGHESHGDSDCPEQTGYDHINGFHECGCPGPLQAQLAQAWEEGFGAAEANDCCGCNLRIDDSGNFVANPYEPAI